jgi:hypothetical protein
MLQPVRQPVVNRRGVLTALVAVMLFILLGFTAIALEGGLMQDNRRRVQAAADAAALAAANELFRNYTSITTATPDPGSKASTAASTSAAQNGFPNPTVKIPPITGPFAGLLGYAEVTINYSQSRYFSSIWGSSATAISARAVGMGKWNAMGNGVIVLDPSVAYALDANGSGGMTVTGGAAVVVDSNNSSAARATGGGQLTANTFNVTGGTVGSFNGTVNTGMPPIADPLAYLPTPTQPPNGSMSKQSLGNGNFQYTLSPGSYSNLPNLSQGDIVIFQQASANNNGGIYYISGGLHSTGANLLMDPATTGGIMIYNAPSGSQSSQQINITGNSSGTVSLSPLTSGPYAGLIMFQDRTSSVGMSITGNGNFTIAGTFYAANANLGITGNGNATIGSQYISRTLSLGGGGLVTINYSDNNTAHQRIVKLVE